LPLIRHNKYITKPDEKDWPREIKKKGENKVPEIKLEAKDLMNTRIRKERGFKSKAKRMAMFPKPNLKKGRIFGRSISAYENNKVKAPR